MSNLCLGVDIGIAGAIAILGEDGALIEIHDMPTLLDGPAARRSVNAPLLAGIVYASHASHAYVEHVAARPGEGPTGAFAFGRARGVIEGVLAAAGILTSWVTPASWKRVIGISGADKDRARSEAIRRWPAQAGLFARKKDDGRAEAALIAVAGLIRGKAVDAA